MRTRRSSSAWQQLVTRQLPLLGHRNWIAIVDAAYPWQTASGVETIATGASQLDVVRFVSRAVEKASHVRALVHLDAELTALPEKDAPGIVDYRAKLAKVLAGAEIHALPHEAIIAKLNEAGATFRVLILKTTMTLPYTSVFLQLDCGYWSADAEKRLRAAGNGSSRKKSFE
jgi:hypothetical protein